MRPAESTARADGQSIGEAVAGLPGTKRLWTPLPASVATVPLGEIWRMRLFCWSATARLPFASGRTSAGLKRCGLAAGKGAQLAVGAVAEPALFVIMNEGSIWRKPWLLESSR